MEGACAGRYFSLHWPNRTTLHGTTAVAPPAFYVPVFLFGFPFAVVQRSVFEDPDAILRTGIVPDGDEHCRGVAAAEDAAAANSG